MNDRIVEQLGDWWPVLKPVLTHKNLLSCVKNYVMNIPPTPATHSRVIYSKRLN